MKGNRLFFTNSCTKGHKGLFQSFNSSNIFPFRQFVWCIDIRQNRRKEFSGFQSLCWQSWACVWACVCESVCERVCECVLLLERRAQTTEPLSPQTLYKKLWRRLWVSHFTAWTHGGNRAWQAAIIFALVSTHFPKLHPPPSSLLLTTHSKVATN